MFTQRPDAVLNKDSLGDLQFLSNIAANKKELAEYQMSYYRKRVELLTGRINSIKFDFQTYLLTNGLDTHYPVFSKVLNDDTLTDLTPENGLTAVDIEKARTRNFSNETIQIVSKNLVCKYLTMMGTVEGYINQLYAMRLEKARMAHSLDQAVSLSKDYGSKVSDASTANNSSYLELKTAYERLIDLMKALIEFNYIFLNVPSDLSSKTSLDMHASNMDKYNVFYVGKKKFISKMINKLVGVFSELNHPELSSDNFLGKLINLSDYFTMAADLPPQYVQAIDSKKAIIEKVSASIKSVSDLINHVKLLMEEIRGTGGDIGNSDLKNLISISAQLLAAANNTSNVDAITTEQIVALNDFSLKNAVEQVNVFKTTLQEGADAAFIAANSWAIKTMTNVIGFIFPNTKSGKDSLKDNVREKVRRQYGGNLRFCDELRVIDLQGHVSFKKNIDMDQGTGKESWKAAGDLLGKKVITDDNILAA